MGGRGPVATGNPGRAARAEEIARESGIPFRIDTEAFAQLGGPAG